MSIIKLSLNNKRYLRVVRALKDADYNCAEASRQSGETLYNIYRVFSHHLKYMKDHEYDNQTLRK